VICFGAKAPPKKLTRQQQKKQAARNRRAVAEVEKPKKAEERPAGGASADAAVVDVPVLGMRPISLISGELIGPGDPLFDQLPTSIRCTPEVLYDPARLAIALMLFGLEDIYEGTLLSDPKDCAQASNMTAKKTIESKFSPFLIEQVSLLIKYRECGFIYDGDLAKVDQMLRDVIKLLESYFSDFPFICDLIRREFSLSVFDAVSSDEINRLIVSLSSLVAIVRLGIMAKDNKLKTERIRRVKKAFENLFTSLTTLVERSSRQASEAIAAEKTRAARAERSERNRIRNLEAAAKAVEVEKESASLSSMYAEDERSRLREHQAQEKKLQRDEEIRKERSDRRAERRALEKEKARHLLAKKERALVEEKEKQEKDATELRATELTRLQGEIDSIQNVLGLDEEAFDVYVRKNTSLFRGTSLLENLFPSSLETEEITPESVASTEWYNNPAVHQARPFVPKSFVGDSSSDEEVGPACGARSA
jgi:hypothetical protein